MHQQISGVHKVIRRRLDGILNDVKTTHFDILCADVAEKTQIDIGGNNFPGGPTR